VTVAKESIKTKTTSDDADMECHSASAAVLRDRQPGPARTSRSHHIEVQISRRTFRDNIRQLRELVAPAKIFVVLKANAYGHGLAALAPVAAEAGTQHGPGRGGVLRRTNFTGIHEPG
jgi:hypothetical protein